MIANVDIENMNICIVFLKSTMLIVLFIFIFKKQEQLLYHFYSHERQGIDKKISWLIKKQIRDSVHKTISIKYYCYVPNPTETEQNAKHFSFSPVTYQKEKQEIIEMKLDPRNYSNILNTSILSTTNGL